MNTMVTHITAEVMQHEVEEVIRVRLVIKGPANAKEIQQYCMEHIEGCKLEDVNAALVDLISKRNIAADLKGRFCKI